MQPLGLGPECGLRNNICVDTKYNIMSYMNIYKGVKGGFGPYYYAAIQMWTAIKIMIVCPNSNRECYVSKVNCVNALFVKSPY